MNLHSEQPHVAGSRQRLYCKRSATQRAADLVFIESRVLRGVGHSAIAAELSKKRGYTLSRQSVSHDIARLRTNWEARARESFGAARARELAQLDAAGAEAWTAWEASKSGKGAGNPAFLTAIVTAHDRRARLLGLLAPVRTEISGPAGAPVQLAAAEPMGMTAAARLELLKRHVQRLEEAQAAGAGQGANEQGEKQAEVAT